MKRIMSLIYKYLLPTLQVQPARVRVDDNDQRGNILVASLLVLVSMNMLGAGLMQTAVKESSMATYKVVDSEVFHITDSCTYDVVKWFEEQTGTPVSVEDVETNDLSFMHTGYETTKELNKLDGYSYNCITSFITSKYVSAGTGQGGEVSATGGDYGGTGGTILKDFYQITATGSGPKNSSKIINTIISVAY